MSEQPDATSVEMALDQHRPMEARANENLNPWEEEPMYTTELLGSIPRTVRFRGGSQVHHTARRILQVLTLNQLWLISSILLT